MRTRKGSLTGVYTLLIAVVITASVLLMVALISHNEVLIEDQRQQIEQLSLERNQLLDDYLYLRERYHDETGRWFRLPSLDSEPNPAPEPISSVPT